MNFKARFPKKIKNSPFFFAMKKSVVAWFLLSCVFLDGGVVKKCVWDKKRIEDQLPKTPSEIFRQKKERGNITYHTPREIHTRVKII